MCKGWKDVRLSWLHTVLCMHVFSRPFIFCTMTLFPSSLAMSGKASEGLVTAVLSREIWDAFGLSLHKLSCLKCLSVTPLLLCQLTNWRLNGLSVLDLQADLINTFLFTLRHTDTCARGQLRSFAICSTLTSACAFVLFHKHFTVQRQNMLLIENPWNPDKPRNPDKLLSNFNLLS